MGDPYLTCTCRRCQGLGPPDPGEHPVSPGWFRTECHGCIGTGAHAGAAAAGHYSPCATCGGAGELWVHGKSEVVALYPGGPFA